MFWLFKRFRRPVKSDTAVWPSFTIMNGRRHLNETPYLLPNDLEDAHRLDFQHFLLRQLLRGNYWAPIERPQSILDVAAGTGRWAMELANEYPQASVVGLDVVPPPDDYLRASFQAVHGKPSNYRFVQRDILTGLPFHDDSFDFVHMRLVFAAVPSDRWLPLVQELARVTRPGGWVELVEGSLLHFTSEATSHAARQLQDWIVQLSVQRDIDLTRGARIAPMLEATGGIRRVRWRRTAITLGARNGRIGVMAEKDIISVFKGIGTALIKAGVTTSIELESLLAQMENEAATGAIEWLVYQAFGQKVK